MLCFKEIGEKNMGLLESIKEICGCLYISDLHLEPYKHIAAKILQLITSSFSDEEIEDAQEYISN